MVINGQPAGAQGLVNKIVNLGIGSGALAGTLLTAPLAGLLYLFDNLAGLPFVPFALFDWIARVLLGEVVIFGIDLMIDGMLAVGMSVAAAAKTAEQIGAVILFVLIGVVVGAIFFPVMKSRSIDPRPIFGLAPGVVFGLPMVAVSLPMGQSNVNPAITVIVLAVLFIVWGLAFIPLYRRLLLRPDGLTTEEEIRWAKSINRRQFLVRLGAVTATITVLSGGLGGVLARSERRQADQAVATTMDPSETSTQRTFPNEGDPIVPAPGTRPEHTPVEDHYQVFIRTEPTLIDINAWSLPITGRVDNPLVLRLEDIQNNYEAMDQYVTLSCISGRIGTSLISTT